MAFRAYPVHTVGTCLEKRWTITIRCTGCGHMVHWRNEMVATLDPRLSMADLEDRLRCEKCSGTEGVIYNMNDHSAAQRRDMSAYEARRLF